MAKLTEKQQAFCEEYVKNGYNGAKAFKSVYACKTDSHAGPNARKLLRDPKIQEEINSVELSYRIIGQEQGLDKSVIMGAIKNLITANKKIYYNGVVIDTVPDNTAIKDGITVYAKLTGDFSEKKDITLTTETSFSDVDLASMSDEEREEFKAAILKEL